MHHKRGRPKNRRAGCLGCKPWKANHAKRTGVNRTLQDRRSEDAESERTPKGRSMRGGGMADDAKVCHNCEYGCELSRETRSWLTRWRARFADTHVSCRRPSTMKRLVSRLHSCSAFKAERCSV